MKFKCAEGDSRTSPPVRAREAAELIRPASSEATEKPARRSNAVQGVDYALLFLAVALYAWMLTWVPCW